MQICPGHIYQLDNSEFVLIIDFLEKDKYSFIPLTENLTGGNKITEIKFSQKLLYPVIREASVISAERILQEIKELEKEKYDKILRELVKHSAQLYLRNTKSVAARKYIPASGKVIGEAELDNMIEASLDMWLTAGRFNFQFEKEFAKFLGVRHALTVNSGSSANLLAITALTSHKLGNKKLNYGDEVITVAAGFPTTIAPIIQNGLIPVFVDVDLQTFNICVSQIEEAISEKTKAIFIAHTLGNTFNIDAVSDICKKNNLWLIEDNCDALGAKYKNKHTGTYGHIATFSFYPAHHITMGEGGAVATNDTSLFEILMSLRDWGRDCYCSSGKDDTCGKRFEQQHGKLPFGYDHKYVYSHLGYNLKITDWQAAIALSQIKKLPEFVKTRQQNFELLKKELLKFVDYFIFPEATENAAPSWFGFWLIIKEDVQFSKKELVDFLETNGIGTRNLFAGNMLRQPVFTDNSYKIRVRSSGIKQSSELTDDDFMLLPSTEAIMNRAFWIGLWHGITSDDIKEIVEKFECFFSGVNQ